MSFPKDKEIAFTTTLMQLTIMGKLIWKINHMRKEISSKKITSDNIPFYYQANFDEKILVLYDISEDLSRTAPPNRNPFSTESRYYLNVLDNNYEEIISFNGKTLKDLYLTVKSNVGDMNSILDELIVSAKRKLIK